MTKQIKNVYQTLYTYENLYQAYLMARKNKRYRDEVLQYSYNVEEELITLSEELENHSYKVGGYREFYVLEPKKRLIMALPFKDRIVNGEYTNYLILNLIEDIF